MKYILIFTLLSCLMYGCDTTPEAPRRSFIDIATEDCEKRDGRLIIEYGWGRANPRFCVPKGVSYINIGE